MGTLGFSQFGAGLPAGLNEDAWPCHFCRTPIPVLFGRCDHERPCLLGMHIQIKERHDCGRHAEIVGGAD